MPTETQLEQRVAALQSDLNERDQRTDDLQFQLKDRECSRRDWFDEAQRLDKENEELKADIRFLRTELRIANDTAALGVKMLAERDALLRDVLDGKHTTPGWNQRMKAALSASAEPSAPVAAVLPEPFCRQKLAAEGKPYPRSNCAVCGPFSPKWRECDAMIEAARLNPPQQ